MKRFTILIVSALAIVGALSCDNKNISGVKYTTLKCETKGFSDGTKETLASWGEGEHFYLYRSEDWTVALMSQSSEGGSTTATFGGSTADSKSGFYAVRPASAAGAIRLSGALLVDVAPSNIFFAEENSSTVVPQIGSGNANGLTFKSMFGALKFDISGCKGISTLKASIPNKEHGLYGTLFYNLKQEVIIDNSVSYSVTRELPTALNTEGGGEVYLALPAGKYSKVELLVADTEAGNKILYIAENVQVKRGIVTDVTNIEPTIIPQLIGSWHLKSFCGVAPEANLYMEFLTDYTFTILQHTEVSGYKQFTGTFTIDRANSIVSGRYSDGESWGDSYKFGLNDKGELVMTSVTNGEEVSIYELSDMPYTASTQMYSRATAHDIKPL